MALITEVIDSETETGLTITFTSANGKRALTKTVPKIEGKTNEEILQLWHRRMTLVYLKNRFVFKLVATEPTPPVE